jgi:hypothetical protein
MTDRELLELAAKAAGFVPAYRYMEKTNRLLWLGQSGFPATWGPFDDDADAFKLAVQLNMTLVLMKWRTEVEIEGKTIVVESVVNDDPCAATRRAIVRAAAEIGKGME